MNSVGKGAAKAAPGGFRAQGLRTRKTIIDVAKLGLLAGGGLKSSLREVAARAGISISNLQYYFPTRLALLRAMIEPVIDAYLENLKRAFDSKESPKLRHRSA